MEYIKLFLLIIQIMFLILEIYFYVAKDDFKKGIICNGIVLVIMFIILII